ncbi:MAG: hypothetical protein JNJ80_14355 [Gemmatimonadetes bacterium]|nr:hypothetical protein [Gemmatimonadota bacterium]
MSTWARRLRGTIGMGLTWALGWAVIGGGVMEGIFDPHGKILDMWPQTLAIPGFIGGVVFSGLLWATAGRRRFEELSLSRFAGWGAVVGVLLGSLALAAGAAGGVASLWVRVAVILGPMALLSAVSATGSLALARLAAGGSRLASGPPRDAIGPADDDSAE